MPTILTVCAAVLSIFWYLLCKHVTLLFYTFSINHGVHTESESRFALDSDKFLPLYNSWPFHYLWNSKIVCSNLNATTMA